MVLCIHYRSLDQFPIGRWSKHLVGYDALVLPTAGSVSQLWFCVANLDQSQEFSHMGPIYKVRLRADVSHVYNYQCLVWSKMHYYFPEIAGLLHDTSETENHISLISKNLDLLFEIQERDYCELFYSSPLEMSVSKYHRKYQWINVYIKKEHHLKNVLSISGYSITWNHHTEDSQLMHGWNVL